MCIIAYEQYKSENTIAVNQTVNRVKNPGDVKSLYEIARGICLCAYQIYHLLRKLVSIV